MCKTNTASTATDLKKSLFQTLDPFIVPRNPVMQSQHLTNQSIPTQLSQDLAQVARTQSILSATAIHEGVSSAILNSDCLLRRDKMLLYSRHGGSLASPCPPKFHFLGVVLPNTCLKSLKQRRSVFREGTWRWSFHPRTTKEAHIPVPIGLNITSFKEDGETQIEPVRCI